VNYGPVTSEKNRSLPDLTPREWALVVPTIAMAILMGVVPGIFLRPMEPSVTRLIERVTANQPVRVRLDRPPSRGEIGPAAARQVEPRAQTVEPRIANGEPRTASRPASRGEITRATARQAEPKP
jgi:hypothetical protein